MDRSELLSLALQVSRVGSALAAGQTTPATVPAACWNQQTWPSCPQKKSGLANAAPRQAHRINRTQELLKQMELLRRIKGQAEQQRLLQSISATRPGRCLLPFLRLHRSGTLPGLFRGALSIMLVNTGSRGMSVSSRM